MVGVCVVWVGGQPARGDQEYGFNTFIDWETQLCLLPLQQQQWIMAMVVSMLHSVLFLDSSNYEKIFCVSQQSTRQQKFAEL